MRCTGIKKNKSGKGLNQKLTYYRVRLLFNLLHVNVVHLSFVEWIGVLPSASISVSIPSFGAIIGIVPYLPALKASNLT